MSHKNVCAISRRETEPALVFLHIPKTGGTTLHHHFSAHFTPDETCPERYSNLQAYSSEDLGQWRFFSGHFNTDAIKLIPRPLFVVTVLRDPIERLISHYHFWKRHKLDYIEQTGHIAMQITKAGTLRDFLSTDNPQIFPTATNWMTSQLAGAVLATPDGYALLQDGEQVGWLSEAQVFSRALRNLLSFDVIGDISQLADIYGRVAQKFGMAPLTEVARLNTKDDEHELFDPYVPEEITPEIQSLLEEKTRLDRMLYQLASGHSQSTLLGGIHSKDDEVDFIPLVHEPSKQSLAAWFASFGY
ncbi:MAG: sulfotransferase family 2 domain-containing protein [Roseomonas sp.]|nr:sulfotransferase family 2 domain-containing protein [Roseomonas sp.]